MSNTGIVTLREKHQQQRTVVVSGVGRSGTTAMIRALYSMGLPKTGKLTTATQDDHSIGQHLNAADRGKLVDEVTRRDNLHDCWGFKWPMVFRDKHLLNVLRNPVMVLMSRDPVAIARRAADAKRFCRMPVDQWLTQVTDANHDMLRFALHETTMPVMLCSYEKLITQPVTCLRHVAKLTGLTYRDASEIRLLDRRYLGHNTRRFEATGD